MSSKKCCVPGCRGTDIAGQQLTLHLFPNPTKERQRFNTWLYSIGGGGLLGYEVEYIFKQRRVCHAHFEDKYCCRNNRILNYAVPTLHLPTKLLFSETRPMRAIENVPVQTVTNVPEPGIFEELKAVPVHYLCPSTSAGPLSCPEAIENVSPAVNMEELNITKDSVPKHYSSPSMSTGMKSTGPLSRQKVLCQLQ